MLKRVYGPPPKSDPMPVFDDASAVVSRTIAAEVKKARLACSQLDTAIRAQLRLQAPGSTRRLGDVVTIVRSNAGTKLDGHVADFRDLRMLVMVWAPAGWRNLGTCPFNALNEQGVAHSTEQLAKTIAPLVEESVRRAVDDIVRTTRRGPDLRQAASKPATPKRGNAIEQLTAERRAAECSRLYRAMSQRFHPGRPQNLPRQDACTTLQQQLILAKHDLPVLRAVAHRHAPDLLS
jgi:hypothetical protein